jgi:hypothetical protein
LFPNKFGFDKNMQDDIMHDDAQRHDDAKKRKEQTI